VTAGHLGMISLFAIAFALWGYMLLRALVRLLFPLKKVKPLDNVIAIVIQFGLQFFFAVGAVNIVPYLTIILSILCNALIVAIIVNVKIYHIILASLIYTITVAAVDMIVVLGLSLLEMRTNLSEIAFSTIRFGVLSFIIAPLVYFGLTEMARYEDERRERMLKRLQLVLTIISLAAAFFVSVFTVHIPSYSWARGINIQTLPFLAVLLAVAMLAGSDFLYAQQVERTKQAEDQALQQYTHDVELQAQDINSFRHDYMNILMSLDEYVKESDNAELKKFFYEKIVKTGGGLYKNATFELQNLSKISNREIKSILIVKFEKMLSENVQVEFEANEKIDDVPIDTIVMVRIIGILLDNAIEEVIHLDKENREIHVALVKEKKDIIFCVSNSCRENEFMLTDLTKKNFTTKGKGRGFGLNNLAGFVSKYDNLFVETKYNNKRFTQIITIEG